VTARARSNSSVGNKVVKALARTRSDNTGSSIVVTSGANPAAGTQASASALGAALRQRTQSEGATDVSEPQTINLAGGDAVVVSYKGTLDGKPIAGRRILTLHGDKAYVLVLEGNADRYEQDLPALDEVISSWSWS
jgi:hypothetical protein